MHGPLPLGSGPRYVGGMAKRKRMVDTSVREEDIELGQSRTKARKERKDLQSRLEALAMRLAKTPPHIVAGLDLGVEAEREIAQLASQKKGSALARQRKRVGGVLRTMDLDEIEAALEAKNR
ncbi:MAG: hypothetical protein CMN30_04115 [Sandaracinus sp.]|nr:hypothetical protein [Sandaracinus sp.]